MTIVAVTAKTARTADYGQLVYDLADLDRQITAAAENLIDAELGKESHDAYMEWQDLMNDRQAVLNEFNQFTRELTVTDKGTIPTKRRLPGETTQQAVARIRAAKAAERQRQLDEFNELFSLGR